VLLTDDARAYLRRVKPKPKLKRVAPVVPTTSTAISTSTSRIPLRFKVNIIGLGKFIPAGMASPYFELSEVPENLRPFIASSVDEPNEPDDSPPSATFVLNQTYDVNANGFRRAKNVQREIVNLQRAQEEQEYWEQRLAESNEQERAALEIVQQDREIGIARDKALAESRQREADMANQHAKKFTEEGDQDGDAIFVSPSIKEQTL
jgi:hypothetical protein